MKRTDTNALNWTEESPTTLLNRVRDANVVGMGGAGYPAASKIEQGIKNSPCTIIANGVETDPGVSADQTLLAQKLDDVITGLKMVGRITQTNMLHMALVNSTLIDQVQQRAPSTINTHLIAPTFQNGEERELIQVILDKRIEPGSYPTDFGIIVFNVHTLFAIREAVRGFKLTERVMTVLGEDRWVSLDKPLQNEVNNGQTLRRGCYETGHLATPDQQTEPTMNAISADSGGQALPCIRCGWCTTACPKSLPVEVFQYDADRHSISNTTRNKLSSCNECGACVTVCPSKIHLVDSIRQLRSELAVEQRNLDRANVARERYEARVVRIKKITALDSEKRADRMHKKHDWS